jgi:hypothetical protein
MTISNNVSLTGTLDIATGGLAWGDVSKSGSSLNDLATISTSKPMTVTNLTVNGTCTGCGGNASFGWAVPVTSNWITSTNAYYDLNAATGIVAAAGSKAIFFSLWEGTNDPDDYASFEINETGDFVWNDITTEQSPFASFPITGTVYIIGITVRAIP